MKTGTYGKCVLIKTARNHRCYSGYYVLLTSCYRPSSEGVLGHHPKWLSEDGVAAVERVICCARGLAGTATIPMVCGLMWSLTASQMMCRWCAVTMPAWGGSVHGSSCVVWNRKGSRLRKALWCFAICGNNALTTGFCMGWAAKQLRIFLADLFGNCRNWLCVLWGWPISCAAYGTWAGPKGSILPTQIAAPLGWQTDLVGFQKLAPNWSGAKMMIVGRASLSDWDWCWNSAKNKLCVYCTCVANFRKNPSMFDFSSSVFCI